MKTVRISFSMHVDDEFKPGNCKKCPMCAKSSHELNYGCYVEEYKCLMGFQKVICPIQEEKEQ